MHLVPIVTSRAIRDDRVACRVGAFGAACTLVGILLSGPLALLAINATHPQPPWAGAEVFALNYHPIQALPYLGGLALVAGLVLLVTSSHVLARPEQKAFTTAAVVLAAVFASFIFLNYTVQTTFLPTLARYHDARNAAIISMLSLVNPTSLAWVVEMWGYAFVGVATWLVAPVFAGSRLEWFTRYTFVANGVLSVIGGLATTARPGWVLTVPGLAAFALWNVLLCAMAILALLTFRRRGRAAAAQALPSSLAERQPARA